MRAIVRHRTGATTKYDVGGVDTWEQARAFVLEQVPSARVVLVLVPRKKPGPPAGLAAA